MRSLPETHELRSRASNGSQDSPVGVYVGLLQHSRVVCPHSTPASHSEAVFSKARLSLSDAMSLCHYRLSVRAGMVPYWAILQ